MPASQDKTVSDAELERRLRVGEVPDKDLPPIPKDAVVMEEDDPDRSKKLRGEGSGGGTTEMGGRAISSLPDRLADRLGAP